MLYSGWNDYELLYLIADYNEFALKIMLDKYVPFIKMVACRCGVKCYDLQDYIQEGRIFLVKAINTYDNNVGKTFFKYYELILERHFWRLRRKEPDEVLGFYEENYKKFYTFREVFEEYSSCLKDKIDKIIFEEIYYYNSSSKSVALKLGISLAEVYKRIKKIREILILEFDLSGKR